MNQEEYRIAVAEIWRIKQQMMRLDSERLWDYRLPNAGAQEDELLAVESNLGFNLPRDYRTFLKVSNGWESFYQAVDLFGTRELLSSEHCAQGDHLLSLIEDQVVADTNLERRDLLPVAVSQDDMDLFVIVTADGDQFGSVIWFAGRTIDKFPSFSDYFKSMVSYIRRELERLERK